MCGFIGKKANPWPNDDMEYYFTQNNIKLNTNPPERDNTE